jgi:D-alanyl-D-alanine carboxypeptidase
VVARIERAGEPAWTDAVGYASLAPRRVLHKEATFRMASNTKTFTAAAVLRLVEQGQLDLEAHLDEFLDSEIISRLNVLDGVAHGDEITIAQLLQHTAGLHEPDSAPYVERAMQDPLRRWTPIEQVELAVRSGAPYDRPGAAARYSNTGYIVASLIIERVSGLPLAQAFRSLLRFDELKLGTIHLETLEPVPSGAAPRMRQYFGDFDIAGLDASIDLYGGGGLVSDVHDLCGFWRALFEGRVFDHPTTLTMMTSTVPGPDPDTDFGLGVFRHRFGAHEVWLHTGFWGTFALFDPNTSTTIAAATNQASSHVPEQALSGLPHQLLEVAIRA